MKLKIRVDQMVDVDIESLRKGLNIVDGMNYYQIEDIIYQCLSDVYGDDIANQASETLTDMVCDTLYYYTI